MINGKMNTKTGRTALIENENYRLEIREGIDWSLEFKDENGEIVDADYREWSELKMPEFSNSAIGLVDQFLAAAAAVARGAMVLENRKSSNVVDLTDWFKSVAAGAAK